ncbi:hypothetical protein ACQP2U_43905 (plasmid) [Nocardia sp. CA-084685]|uniref:hypothetical protein n=1 Tax=Nocardia sp. CA-084685 TaxID=3239970 RepID=UPI003D987CC1
MRLEQPEDLYADVPSCWWSRRRWVAYSMALYDLLYAELRATLRAPSVSRNTFQAWAIAESKCADLDTGRECRPSVRHLSERIERHPRTVKRCRELARLLDLRQVVFTGRHRTKLERLASYDREDRSRGWAAVAALIESPSYAYLVDNSTLESLLEQDFVTPLPRSGGSLFLSRQNSVTSTKNVIERRAPRGRDKKVRPKTCRAYDERALLLASQVKRDERFPLWIRQMPRQGLAAVLTKRALNGWTADDVYLALNEVLIAGKRIFGNPTDPYAYLGWLLNHTPVNEPPALLDRAREVAQDEARRAAQRETWKQMRAKAIAAADSPARAAAMAKAAELGRRAVGTAAARHQSVEAARRELARQARED